MSESLVFSKKIQKMFQKIWFKLNKNEWIARFCEQKSEWAIYSEKTSYLLIRLFIMSNLGESLTVAHLSWATWAIRSWSFFLHERPERLAHCRSFVLSDLSKSLTVAHLIWAIGANEQMSNERMSEFTTLYILQFFKSPLIIYLLKAWQLIG